MLVILFLENTREFPQIITRTGAKFWLRFCLSVLVLVIFKSPKSIGFPWCFGVFSAYFTGTLRVRRVREILGVFEGFLGFSERPRREGQGTERGSPQSLRKDSVNLLGWRWARKDEVHNEDDCDPCKLSLSWFSDRERSTKKLFDEDMANSRVNFLVRFASKPLVFLVPWAKKLFPTYTPAGNYCENNSENILLCN